MTTIHLTISIVFQPIMILLDCTKYIRLLSSYSKSITKLKKLGLERNTVLARRLAKACMLRFFNVFYRKTLFSKNHLLLKFQGKLMKRNELLIKKSSEFWVPWITPILFKPLRFSIMDRLMRYIRSCSMWKELKF